MKTAVIFYFTGTGNTQWAANRLAQQMTNSGVSTESVSIEAIRGDDIAKAIEPADMVGFGYPIYGSDLPDPMKDFINNLPMQQQKPTFVFCTQMMFSGDGAFVFKKTLKEKGYPTVYTQHFNMPNDISMVSSLLKVPTDKKQEKIMEKVKVSIDAFAKALSKNKKSIHIRAGAFLGAMQRGPYRALFKKGNIRDDLDVDQEKCIKCGRCTRICPVNNIIQLQEYPEWQGNCVLCTRCYNFCPTLAITYRGKKHNSKFAVYKGPYGKFKPERVKKR